MDFSFLLGIIIEIILYLVKQYVVRQPRRSSVLVIFFIVTVETVEGNTEVFKKSASLKISHGLHVYGVELTSAVPIHFLVPLSFPTCMRA